MHIQHLSELNNKKWIKTKEVASLLFYFIKIASAKIGWRHQGKAGFINICYHQQQQQLNINSKNKGTLVEDVPFPQLKYHTTEYQNNQEEKDSQADHHS